MLYPEKYLIFLMKYFLHFVGIMPDLKENQKKKKKKKKKFL